MPASPTPARPTATPLAKIIGAAVPTITMVDVGAGVYSTTSRYTPLYEQNLINTVGFEPNEEEFLKVTANAKPNFRCLPYALGDGKEATLHITALPQCSSIYEPDMQVLGMFNALAGAFRVVKKVPMGTWRLDDLKECPQPDVLKIDVQGAELDVLQGGVNFLKKTLIVECEVEFIRLYKNQPLLGNIHAFMDANGFILHKLIDIQGRPLGKILFGKTSLKTYGQVLWSDAVFIHQSLLLAPQTVAPADLLKAAAIFYDVYHSYDLAVSVIAHYDRLMKTSLAPRLLAHLRTAPLERTYMNLIDDIEDLERSAGK